MFYGMVFYNEEGDDVLLFNKYVLEGLQEGGEVEVFVYIDFEDWLIVIMQCFFVQCDQYVNLLVKEIFVFGAWMDMGLDKDLFVFFFEQDFRMEVGKYYLVYVYVDEEIDCFVGFNCFCCFLFQDNFMVEEGQEVDFFIFGFFDLGVKVVVNGLYEGLIFKSDIFCILQLGECLKGFVKIVCLDGKLDLILQFEGYVKVEFNVEKILVKFCSIFNGFLVLYDKSDFELICEQL